MIFVIINADDYDTREDLERAMENESNVVINANDYDTREDLEKAMENIENIALKHKYDLARARYVVIVAQAEHTIASLTKQIEDINRKIDNYYKYLREKKSNANLNSS